MTETTQQADPKIRQIQGEVIDRTAAYEVESATRVGSIHTVTVRPVVDADGLETDQEVWGCTCEAGQYQTPCWHRDYVRAVHYFARFERRRQTQLRRLLKVQAGQQAKAAQEDAAAARPAGKAALQELFS